MNDTMSISLRITMGMFASLNNLLEESGNQIDGGKYDGLLPNFPGPDIPSLQDQWQQTGRKVVRDGLARGVFLAGYSEFEGGLNTISQRLLSDKYSGLALRHLSGGALERFKRIYVLHYLSDEYFNGNNWQRVCDLRDIRNIISHSGGVVTNDESAKSSVIRFVNESNDLSFSDPVGVEGLRRIFVEPDFAKDALSSFWKVIKPFSDLEEEGWKQCST